MADIIIGRPSTHPSKKLKAGQVKNFAQPAPTQRCNYCGQLYNNATEHPNA